MNKTLIALYIVLALVAGAVVGQQVERSTHKDSRASVHELVYGTCQLSRIGDMVTEQECADVQYKYGVEYLCGKADNLKAADRNCWTEYNYNLERY